jgi:hypothetical protein
MSTKIKPDSRGLDPGIHSGTVVMAAIVTEWIARSSPAMTTILIGHRSNT